MKILVVDDNLLIRRMLDRFLTAQGHKVTLCENGVAAIELFQEMEQPLIIADVMMPYMDGFQLCQKIRELPNGDLPVILVLTILEAPEVLEQVLEAGADDYLPKIDLINPVDAKMLGIRLKIAERQVQNRFRRKKAEQELKNHQLHLKELVEKRTGELRRINEKLQWEIKEREQTENSLKTIIAASPLAIIALDPQQRVTLWSPAAEKIYGWQEQEVLGKFNPVVPENYGIKESFLEFMHNMIEGKNYLPVLETKNIRKDGTLIDVEISIAPLHDKNGEIIGAMGIISDISGRKKTESQLRKLWSAVEQSSSVVVITDIEGKIEFVNPKFTKVTGYTESEVLEKNPRILKSGYHSQEFYKNLWSKITKGGEWRSEFCNRKKDGSFYWELASISGITDKQGRITNYVKVAEDITERKKWEGKLQEAKELAEAASRAKSEFLANMSHELRTPLNGILGYSQILKRDQTLSPKQKEGIEIIERSGEHLLMMITDILDISKIEARKMELESTDFNLTVFLRTIIEIIEIRSQDKGLAFEYHFSENLPLFIHTDAKRLRQILLNLLSNAVKFTGEGKVTLNVERYGDKIRFQIEDTGVGIPEKELKSVFEPFQQAGASKLRTEGTGLGLAISTRLVQMMGSQLHVESEVNKGSKFWFDLELPDTKEIDLSQLTEETQKQFKTIIGYKGEKRKILIVDDKKENLAVLKDILLPLNFEIMEATNGKIAIEKAEEFLPDIILMDLFMPVMDGFEAAKKIRKIEKVESIIIGISASVSEEIKKEAFEASCDDFISKPVCLDELLGKLQEILDLEWLYVESEVAQLDLDKRPKEEFEIPSEEQVKELYTLATDGDISQILIKLDQIEMKNSQLTHFTNNIRSLAKGFHINKILSFIEQFMKK